MAEYCPRMLLEEKECLGKPERVGENKRSDTWQALGGSIARSWIGAPDEEEWADAND